MSAHHHTLLNVRRRPLQEPTREITENKQQSLAHRCRRSGLKLPAAEIRKEILSRFARPVSQSIRTIRTRMKEHGVDEWQIQETLRAELESRPRPNRFALNWRDEEAA